MWKLLASDSPAEEAFHQPVKNVSAVIPTLNEANYIHECISALLGQPHLAEIIVADGGSADDTVRIAASAGAQVVCCNRRGRGFQIHEGIDNAGGDVLLFIHADCRIRKGATARAVAAFNADPYLYGGAYAMAFLSRSPALWIIALLNNLRARFAGISFGDQGQFIRREALSRIGGFPNQMLMEDVELSLRLKGAGKTVLLPLGIMASARRWESQCYPTRVFQVLRLLARYLLAHRAHNKVGDAAEYYRQYYHK